MNKVDLKITTILSFEHLLYGTYSWLVVDHPKFLIKIRKTSEQLLHQSAIITQKIPVHLTIKISNGRYLFGSSVQ